MTIIIPTLIVFTITLINSATLSFYLFYYSKIKNYKKTLPKVKKLLAYPSVSIHIPIRNEPIELVERVVKKCIKIEYPKEKLQIIIISDDDREYFDTLRKRLKNIRTGIKMKLIHREKPAGFKAGALNEALKHTIGKYIAVLDVDSVPGKDFLLHTLPYLEHDRRIAAVECKWWATNAEETRIAQAIGYDMPYVEEVLWKGRQGSGFQPFLYGNGCIIRKDCLKKLGGWDETCMLEDVELGLRFLLNDYRILYLERPSIGVDVPETYNGYKMQQSRWIYGSVEMIKRKFREIMKSRLRFCEKIEALFFLSQYSNFVINFLPLPVFIVYFLFMYGVLNVLSIIGYLETVKVIVGAIIIPVSYTHLTLPTKA